MQSRHAAPVSCLSAGQRRRFHPAAPLRRPMPTHHSTRAEAHTLLLVHAAFSGVCCAFVARVPQIPKELYHSFDFIVIDPPFITAEVWADYAKAAKLLLVEGTEVSCSRVAR